MSYDTYKALHMSEFGCNPRRIWHDAHADGVKEEQDRIFDILREKAAKSSREVMLAIDDVIEDILGR
ncbi:MAG TPA: hypothetical protein VK149_04165 [Sideroxyarcus sp.]|nr:hypothetical protein [Sideroxyarcus sp.]